MVTPPGASSCRHTHVGEAAPAVQSHSSLKAEHGRPGELSSLLSMLGMLHPACDCSRLVIFCPAMLLQVDLPVAPYRSGHGF